MSYVLNKIDQCYVAAGKGVPLPIGSEMFESLLTEQERIKRLIHDGLIKLSLNNVVCEPRPEEY